MPVDFSSLVLAPAMNTFARPVTIDPIKSRPGSGMPYAARGVISSRSVDIVLADGAVMSDQRTTLGIRDADENADGTPMFAVLPVRGDKVRIESGPYQGDFWVGDIDADGQGGSVITLRREFPVDP